MTVASCPLRLTECVRQSKIERDSIRRVKCSRWHNKEMWWLDTDRTKICDDWNSVHQQKILQLFRVLQREPLSILFNHFIQATVERMSNSMIYIPQTGYSCLILTLIAKWKACWLVSMELHISDFYNNTHIFML